MTTTGPVMDQFIALIQGGEEWVSDLIQNALELGVPVREVPEAVVAWAWGGTPMDSERDAFEGWPSLMAEWTRFNEGPESKWNDPRYLRERFPDSFNQADWEAVE